MMTGKLILDIEQDAQCQNARRASHRDMVTRKLCKVRSIPPGRKRNLGTYLPTLDRYN